MPINKSLADIINSAQNSTPRAKVGPGEYKMKVVSAETGKSQKNKPMTKITLEVIEANGSVGGKEVGGTVKAYYLHDIDDDTCWKIASLCAFAKAYKIPEKKFNNDMVEDWSDFIGQLTICLNKVSGKTPELDIKMTRKEVGTTSDGKPNYRDFYSVVEKTEAEETEAEKTEEKPKSNDDFYADI